MKRPILLVAIIVFILIGIVGLWYWQNNTYSKDILKVELLGPESVQAGEDVNYIVKIKNNGNIRLEDAELIFQAPEQAVLDEYSDLRVTEKIEDIYPGEERTYSFSARLFGKEDSILTAKTWVSFKPKNLTARYESKTTLASTIDYVPITFEFDMPSNVERGENFNFSMNYFSNVSSVLENLRVKIEYPEGFNFVSADPHALDETEWPISSLVQASGGKINITGNLDINEGESRVFRAKLGMIRDGQFWPLREAVQTTEVMEPSLHISHLINNSQGYTAHSGELLHYEIYFKNIGESPVQKKFLFVTLDGDFFDLSTLRSTNGEFGDGDDTILWDWKDVSDLRFLDSDQEGSVEFWVRVKKSTEREIKNPLLRAKASLGGVEKVFETKVGSDILLSQKAYYDQEFFDSSGPIPPKVGESTNYVISWQVKNSWNDLKNVKVRSKLPNNVNPTGNTFPEDAKFTYDSTSREVLWNIGDMKAWDYKDEPLTLAFQVSFTPSSSDEGETPVLSGEAKVSGEDTWTSEILSESASEVDTTLPDDNTVSNNEGRVTN